MLRDDFIDAYAGMVRDQVTENRELTDEDIDNLVDAATIVDSADDDTEDEDGGE